MLDTIAEVYINAISYAVVIGLLIAFIKLAIS